MDTLDWQSFYLDGDLSEGHHKEAKFSIFDSPEEVEQALAEKEPEKPKESQEPEGSKWEQFLSLFYEGGKKKVKNPNPKTQKKYPEVQLSTALKDQVFAGKVKKEYEAWLAQGESDATKTEPVQDVPESSKEEKPKKKPKLKVGDKITSTDQLHAGMIIQGHTGAIGRITSMTPDGGFRYKTWSPSLSEWGGASKVTKEQADSYFSSQEFVVVADPEKAKEEKAKEEKAKEEKAKEEKAKPPAIGDGFESFDQLTEGTVFRDHDGDLLRVSEVGPDKIELDLWIEEHWSPKILTFSKKTFSLHGKKWVRASQPAAIGDKLDTLDQLTEGMVLRDQDGDFMQVVKVGPDDIKLKVWNWGPTGGEWSSGVMYSTEWFEEHGKGNWTRAEEPEKESDEEKTKEPKIGDKIEAFDQLEVGTVFRDHDGDLLRVAEFWSDKVRLDIWHNGEWEFLMHYTPNLFAKYGKGKWVRAEEPKEEAEEEKPPRPPAIGDKIKSLDQLTEGMVIRDQDGDFIQVVKVGPDEIKIKVWQGGKWLPAGPYSTEWFEEEGKGSWTRAEEPKEPKKREKTSPAESPKNLEVGDKITSIEQLQAGMFLQVGSGALYQVVESEGKRALRKWDPTAGSWKNPFTPESMLWKVLLEHLTVTEDPEKKTPDEEPKKLKVGDKPTSVDQLQPGFVFKSQGGMLIQIVKSEHEGSLAFRTNNSGAGWGDPITPSSALFEQLVKDEKLTFVGDDKASEETDKSPSEAEKANVGDVIHSSSQLSEGDWVHSVDPDSPSDIYIAKVIEVVGPDDPRGPGVVLQDYSPTQTKFVGKPWFLADDKIPDEETKKADPPKKVKKPLAGKPVTDPKKVKEHDVLRIHDYATGDTITAVVAVAEDGTLGLHVVSAKTGKIKETKVISPEDFDNFQVHRMPASKVPKALQPPGEGEVPDAAEQSATKKLKEQIEKLKAKPEEKEPEKPKVEEPKKPAEKTKAKAVDAKKWQLKTEHVSWDDIKPDDMVHTEWGPQRVVSRTSTGLRLDSGIVLTKSQVTKEGPKYVVSRGDKPQREKPPKAPERPTGSPVTKPEEVKEGDVIEYEHGGITYRGEVVSWDEPGVKFRVKILYPPEKLDKYQSYDAATGEMKYTTPSFDVAKILKRKPRILSQDAMKEFDKEVKEYTERVKEIDKKYAEDVAEYEAAMAGKTEVDTGPLKHVQPPESWNHGSSIAREADRFFEQYKAIMGPDIEKMVQEMSSGQSYWTGPHAAWEEMSEGERKLAQSAHKAAETFRKLLTDEEWSAWTDALSSWQGSSGAGSAHILMGSLETLGVEGGPKYFETANVQHYRQKGRDNEALHRAVAKAMAYSQLVYEALGLTHVHLYRGTGTKPVKGAPQGKSITTTTARELASFSIDPSVAYSFAGSDKRVVRYRVPISRLFVSPLTYAPLSSAQPPHQENEYVVAGQDGMEGKVMPQYSSDFDTDKMKLASTHDDAPLIIAFSDFEDDWLRPNIIKLWWNQETWDRDHAPPLFRIARKLMLFAREHVGFRRELIAALRPKRGTFSVFDTPETVEMKSAPGYGKMTFETWFAKRYEGGKKKVKNPNPKTQKKYPEVAASTAMRDSGFAKKIYDEYQQEMSEAKETSKPTGIPQPDEVSSGKVTQPSDVKKGDVIRYEFKGKEYLGVVTETGPDLFRVEVYNPKTGKPVMGKHPSFDADKIKERKVQRAELPKTQPDKAPEESAPNEDPAPTKADSLDLDTGDFTQVGPQTGSNPGGLYEGKDGTRYYVKTPATEDRARNEILAGKLYELAGIDVPELTPATRDGKFSVASKIIPGLKRSQSKLKAGGVPGVAEGIAVDAWLANWDVVGLEYDNLLVDEEGRGRRVDTGGALRYRAMGGPKGDDFGPEVMELDVFTDRDRRAGGVLGHATSQQIVESIDRVLAIPETKIRALVHQWGPKDDKEREKLIETLMARRESLREQREKYTEKGKTAKMNETTKHLLRLAKSQEPFRHALATQLKSVAPRDFTIDPGSQEAMLRGLMEDDIVRVTFWLGPDDEPERENEVIVEAPWNETIPGVEIRHGEGVQGLLVNKGPNEGVLYQPKLNGPAYEIRRLSLVKSRVASTRTDAGTMTLGHLGGMSRLASMIEARNFRFVGGAVSFEWPAPAGDRSNKVRLARKSTGDYEVHFVSRLASGVESVVRRFRGVPGSRLAALFKYQTGQTLGV